MRFVRATIALAVVIAAALAPSGATAAATASARSPFSISPPLRGRPHIVPTATGGALVLPNGLHADLGDVVLSSGRMADPPSPTCSCSVRCDCTVRDTE